MAARKTAKKPAKKSTPKSQAGKAKASMKCGQKKRSYKKNKKIMQKVCENGKEKIIHAGDSRYSSNKTPEQRKNFRTRHKCDTAKKGTAKKLACEGLWSKSSKSRTGTSAAKRKTAKTGKKKK